MTVPAFHLPSPRHPDVPVRYTVGDLYNFTDDDAQFSSLQEAADHALECSEADSTFAFGVWDDEGTCHLIAYGGDLYRK